MVKLIDLIQKEQFQKTVLLETLRKSVFISSGVVSTDPELSKLLNAHIGKTASFAYFKDLDDVEARISDDSNTIAGTQSISTDEEIARFHYRNQSWGAKNITASLSLTGDPLVAIAGRIAAYWARQLDITVMAIVDGLIAENIVTNASDFVNDQSAVAVDVNMFIDTKQTAGDAADDLFGAVIVHSAIKTSLQKQAVLDRVYDDQGNFIFETLMGLQIIVNDSVGNSAGVYDSYVIGGGLISYGEGTPKMANEIERSAATGNGAGEETLWNRKEFCLHPKGFSFSGASVSTSPTNAELEVAGAYTRVVERKRVKIAVLRSLA